MTISELISKLSEYDASVDVYLPALIYSIEASSIDEEKDEEGNVIRVTISQLHPDSVHAIMFSMIEKFGNIFIVLMVAFCLFAIFVMMPYTMYVTSQCIAKGYPHSAITIDFEAYCVRRENNTEVVVKLRDL